MKYLNSKINKILNENSYLFSDNDKNFIKRIYSNGIKRYSSRISMINFTNGERVLDAGCGFGQWSIALAKQNNQVESIDPCKLRIDTLKKIICSLGMKNINTRVLKLEEIDYPDNSFDSIFCYSVIFRSNPEIAIKKFKKIIRPGGKLYLCSNGLGWYLYNIIESPNKSLNFDPSLAAIGAINRAINKSVTNKYNDFDDIISSERLSSILIDYNFKLDYVGAEGTFSVNNNLNDPFFIGEYMGEEGVYEILAKCSK